MVAAVPTPLLPTPRLSPRVGDCVGDLGLVSGGGIHWALKVGQWPLQDGGMELLDEVSLLFGSFSTELFLLLP